MGRNDACVPLAQYNDTTEISNFKLQIKHYLKAWIIIHAGAIYESRLQKFKIKICYLKFVIGHLKSILMNNYKAIHFIGIGGIGISSLAYLALKEGKRVTGSDSTASTLIDCLAEEGAQVFIGHNRDNVSEDTELVIYTEAIDRESNPEFLMAKEMGITTLSYFQALGQISRTKKTIAVVGTHGKTTTTAMLGLALIKANLDPLVIVGSKVREFGNRNINMGKGDFFVAEGCEYRRSFMNLEPFGVVFLNCEAEHLDYYKNERDYMEAYKDLVEKIPPDGFLVANFDDKNVKKIADSCAGKIIGVREQDALKLNLRLKILGEFNQLNATEAYRAAEAVGADLDLVKKALEEFAGTWRRMEVKGKFNSAILIDDYGHHPTEVFQTLKAIKTHYKDKKLICVFQPHQYSRTHLLINEFKGAFEFADEVIITDIYAARDTKEDMAKINAEKFVSIIAETHRNVIWGKSLEDTYKLLKKSAKKGDVVVTMGAGSIGSLADRLAETK